MQRTVEKVFFALIRFEINGDELCDEMKNLITPEMLPVLFKLAKRHDLAHLIGDALDKNKLLPEGSEEKKRFLQERNMAVYRYEQIQYEFEQICQTLETIKIPFIPLKGSVIRQYYPESWMRTSCDIDVLVKEEDLSIVVEGLESLLNYKRVRRGNHDLSLFSESGVHLELHYSLAEENYTQKVGDILRIVWEKVVESKSYIKFMMDEMFYFYHIAHMVKHFEIGGCGVRPFLDIYLLRRDEKYLSQECRKILKDAQLLTFAEAVERTSEIWFAGQEEIKLAEEIKDYILYAGMYGDTENRVVVHHIKKGGRFKYLWSRIFLTYNQLVVQYPKLERKKWLLPFYQVKRWIRLLFGKDSQNVSKELKVNMRFKNDKKSSIAKLLEDLGL